MTVRELNREQLTELKGNYLCDMSPQELRMVTGEDAPSWGTIINADSIISDEEIFYNYDGIDFSNDDFGCTAGM